MTKRTFIAINLDSATKVQLARILGSLPKHFAINPTKIDNLHLTLKFLGDVEEEMLPDITSMLDQVCANLPALELNFGRIGAFPNWQTPKIVWIELSANQLTLLQSEIEQQIKTLVISQDEKPFKPHLTLARIKAHLPQNISKAMQVLQLSPILPTKIMAVDLMTSELTPTGPIYRKISSSKLNLTLR